MTWVLKMALNKKRSFFILGVLWEGLIIGRGSCANVASQSMVDEWKLVVSTYPKLYIIQ